MAGRNRESFEDILNRIGEKISAAIKSNSTPAGAPVPTSGLAQTTTIVTMVGGILAIVVILLGGLNYMVSNAVTKAMDQPGKNIAKLTEQVADLRRDVDRLFDRAAENTFRSPPSFATKEAAEQVQEAAEWARQRRLAIEPRAIEKAASPFLNNVSPDSWSATLSLINLRSSVNSTLQEAKQNIAQVLTPADRGMRVVAGPGNWIEFRGFDILLDGTQSDMRVPAPPGLIFDKPGHIATQFGYAIFKDCKIIYRGGQISLTNVFFDNCTFALSDDQKAQMLAANILARPFVTF